MEIERRDEAYKRERVCMVECIGERVIKVRGIIRG
jgi:hypothetical protein